jgi:hypothetical protein
MSPNEIVGETEARRVAEKTLAFDIGNIPHLGETEESDSEYIFPLETNAPRVIFDEDRERPVDVKFMSTQRVGEIRVDKNTGDVSDRSHIYEIERRIRRQQKEVETAVKKALVRSSAGRFSHIPFAELRYTPILDILSHLILQGPIVADELASLGAPEEQKYKDYIKLLEKVDLIRRRNDEIIADDIFIEIQAQKDKHSDMLDNALAHFFREGANHIEEIERILGPYLLLAGYYYRRALEVEGYPKITEEEFKRQIRHSYGGQNRQQKQFKLSRYLIQLEEVGILETTEKDERTAWKGEEEVKADLLREEEMLAPISSIIA